MFLPQSSTHCRCVHVHSAENEESHIKIENFSIKLIFQEELYKCLVISITLTSQGFTISAAHCLKYLERNEVFIKCQHMTR